MTIDEAIQHCREQVQEQAKKGCYSCAEEHQQLAEWLKELKAYKDARAEINQALNDDVRGEQNDYERGRKSGIFLCESIISVKLGESRSEKPNKWIDAEVLDKIRAEIDQYLFQNEFGSAYRKEVSQIIDKYKAESEVQG